MTPDLVFDEPVATGVIRVELYGASEVARRYLHAGRVQLGVMRSRYGVNERIAAGEGGGFYHQQAMLPDGTIIHTLTNDGQDTVRIFAKAPPPLAVEAQPEKEVKQTKPYLWVGARIKSGMWFGMDVWLVEPDGTERRGVVNTVFTSSGSWSVGRWFDMDSGSYNIAPRADGPSETRDLDRSAEHMAQQMYDTWYNPSGSHFSQDMALGDHNFAMEFFKDGSLTSKELIYTCSANGVSLIYWLDTYMTGPDGYTDYSWLLPYDPLLSEEDNAGASRDLSGIDFTGIGVSRAMPAWDAVFVLDPLKKEAVAAGSKMVDARPEILAIEDFLQDAPITPQVLPGNYKMVVRAYDTSAHYESTRSGQAITDYVPELDPSLRFRSADCDYQDYMVLTNTWTLDAEVEVRLGRVGEGGSDPVATFKFDITGLVPDERYSVSFPFGQYYPYDACQTDGGGNMGGPSFSQVIDIDVNGMTATLGGKPPERALAHAAYHAYQPDQLSPAMFFVHGGVFPSVSAAEFPSRAAAALWKAAESVTSGAFGCSIIHEYSQSYMEGQLAGADPTHVYAYDPVNGEFTDLGSPSTSPSDWASNDPPDDSVNFFWYYEHAVAFQNACFNTYGVLVYSAGDAYEMSQNFLGTPGFTNPNCCLEV